MIDSPSRLSWWEHSLGALLTLYCVLLAIYVTGVGFFFADDLKNLHLAQSLPLTDLIWQPIDIHFVPFHRLSFWLLQNASPMNYGIAVAFLTGCHALTLIALWRLLNLIRPSRLNMILVCVYAGNAFLLPPLAWITSGVHRFPCILFSVASLHWALRFALNPRAGSFLASVLLSTCALGFYAKSVLVPAYVFGLALCLFRVLPARTTERLVPIAVIQVLIAAAYVTYSQTLVQSLPSTPPSPGAVFGATQAMLAIFTEGFFLFESGHRTFPEPTILFLPAAVAAWTTWRAPRNALTWCVVLGWFTLNSGLLTMGRGFAFGIWATLMYRYYFEMAFFVIIGAKVILTNVQLARPTGDRCAAIANSNKLLLAVSLLMALCAHRSVQLFTSSETLLRGTRRWLGTLIEDVGVAAKSSAEGRVFLFDGWFPFELRQANAYNLSTYSEFLRLTSLPVSFDTPSVRAHVVSDHGSLVPLRVDPSDLRIELRGLKIALPFEVAGLTSGTDGCVQPTGLAGGTLTIRLPPLAYPGTMLALAYESEHPIGIDVHVLDNQTRSWRQLTPPEFVLPAGGHDKALLVNTPDQTMQLESLRLHFRHSIMPACVRTIRVVSLAPER